MPQIPIFSDLGRDAFMALMQGMVLHRIDQGDAILREGEEGNSFYVVASGRFAVSKRDERGEAILLAHLGEGDFFGEMALLSGAPRAATVTAEAPCEVLEFKPEVLVAIARQHPQLAQSIRRFYRQRLLANAMATSAVFRPFPPADRKLIMSQFVARETKVGEAIVREGEPSDGLYVVLEGAVNVTKRQMGKETLVAQLREGDLFGEMSCLRKIPATASVVVSRAGILLKLPRKTFDELVVAYPQILELVSDLSSERTENLDAILSGHAEWTDEGLVLT
jgi:CRP-like cAMP-binding protein